jgi:hypothetical protein
VDFSASIHHSQCRWFIGFANGENANHYIRAIEINVEAIGSIGVYF